MGNKMSGHDDDDMKRVKGRYAGEMLFDDEDDYDDDADDYSDDHGRTGIARMIIPTAHLDRAQTMKRMRHQKRKLIHRMMNIMKMNMRKKSRI